MNNWLEKLEIELKKREVNKSGLAFDLGLTPQAVYNWFYGKSEPSKEVLIAIENKYGVKCTEWRD